MRKKNQKNPSLFFLLLAMLGACTYETEIQKSEEYSKLVLSPDGKRYAYLYHIMRYRRPSGISKFPDGGVSLYLEDRVTLMLCDAKGPIIGSGPRWHNNCERPYAVLEVPFKYKPGRAHMTISYTELRWIGDHRIAYDLQSLSVVSGKGESQSPNRMLNNDAQQRKIPPASFFEWRPTRRVHL